MGYEKRIAEDWLHTYSNDDEVGSDRDPLFIMETVIEANPSTSWLILLEIINLDIDGLTTEVLAFGPFASWAYHYARDRIETIEHEAATTLSCGACCANCLKTASTRRPGVGSSSPVWNLKLN